MITPEILNADLGESSQQGSSHVAHSAGRSALIISLPIVIILALTLLLLQFIGYAEAKRKHLNFEIQRLATQAEIIKHTFDPHLQAGLPLAEFSGFANQSERLLSSDPSIENIQIFDTHAHLVFFNASTRIKQDQLMKDLKGRRYDPARFVLKLEGKVLESEESFRVVVPLESRFGPAGEVLIEANKEDLLQLLNQQFTYVFYVFLGLIAGYIVLVSIHRGPLARNSTRQTWLKAGFILNFLVMASVTVGAIFHIYEHGARASAHAMAESMSGRITAILELGIDLPDIARLEETFAAYQHSNPDINRLSLIVDGKTLVDTDPHAPGSSYIPPLHSFSHIAVLPEHPGGKDFEVAVTIPTKIVFNAIWSSAKAFVVLLVACGLISFVFLDGAAALMQMGSSDETHGADENKRFQMGLHLVKPAYFLIVFVNALSVSFLPQLAAKFAAQSGSSWATTSLPFSLFYIWFALVLMPSGSYAERGNLKKLMAVGYIAETIGLVLAASSATFWMLTLGRVFSGIGQGAFLIGLQSYVLAVTPKDKQTQGAAVKVVGRNAGMVAGTSIGALLYAYLDYSTLFTISSVITIGASIFLWALVPPVEEITLKVQRSSEYTGMWRRFFLVIRDLEFMLTMTLVGLTSKIAVAGVVMFAIPLIMTRQKFGSEDIGLALMVFYITSLFMTYWISAKVDRSGKTRFVLSISAWVGGIGMVMLGLIWATTWTAGHALPGGEQMSVFGLSFQNFLERHELDALRPVLMLFFVGLIGISNGLSTAPELTHIVKTPVAKRQGGKSVSATYTFIERGGHVLGPVVMGYLLTVSQQNSVAIALFGVVMIVTGLLFQLVSRSS